MAKVLFFGGFGLGTFVAGIISDTFGRKVGKANGIQWGLWKLVLK